MKRHVLILSLIAMVLSMGLYVSAQLFDTTRTKGDVNKDGVVNILDALRGVNMILEIQPQPTDDEVWAADCNGDGQLNIIDVLGIVNVILDIGTCVSSCAEMNCDDENPCTEDYCDSLLIECFHDTVSAGTNEVCGDGVDNDCDGLKDCQDGDCFADKDEDGYPAPPCGNDCNDWDASIHPNATELCDGKDNDCDQVTDEEGAVGCTTYYRDDDNDGYGKTSDSKCLCAAASPYDAMQNGDCSDNDASVHPGATESCNGKDDDCDQTTDEEGATGCTVYYRDDDNDGYGQSADSRCLCAAVSPYDVTQGGDFNDNDASVHPGATELCNGIDDDCDGQTDEELTLHRYYQDSDSDGYGCVSAYKDTCAVTPPTGYVTDSTDCLDSDASVHPGATESCNGKNDDCDQVTDEEGATGCTVYYRDNDDDGYGQSSDSKCLCVAASPYDVTQSGDCDDSDASIYPGATEICNDTKDNDCDGDIDCNDSGGCSLTDIDGNTYQAIQIGDQCWMAENLKVTHYRNGDAIPNVTDNTEWYNLTTGAYCNYNNDTNYVATYGRLYNWYAVADTHNIAPTGWHVPTDEEWKELEIYLGMSQSQADLPGWRGTNEGSKLAGNASLWYSGALEDNPQFGTSGFSALPGGCRGYYGTFDGLGIGVLFWSAAENGSYGAWGRSLNYLYAQVARSTLQRGGFSFRCVRD